MNEINETNRVNIGKAIGATVAPEYTFAIALGAVAKYFIGTNTAALAGAAIGYVIGKNSEVTIDAKRQIVHDIISERQQVQQQQIESGMTGYDDYDTDGIMNSSDLLRYKYDHYPFTGKWLDFVGEPSKRFHAMIYGRPKQGKSILAVQFAKYLSENFGRVLYVASEEGFSVTLQRKVSEFAMDNKNLDFANFRDFEQIRNAVLRGNYQFVFIDSVNYIRITPEDIEDIKAENPNTAFITIQQATKSGNFRGSQEFAHNCDIIIRVEAGLASHQGRFQVPSEMQVFEQEEQKKDAPLLGASDIQLDLFSDEQGSESAF